MNFIEIVLTEKLREADSALDVLGSDRKVLQVCCQDFINFLKFQWNLVGKEANQCEVVEKLECFFKENPAELEAFMTVWTGIWLRKWKERVKILIGNQNSGKWDKAAKTLNNAEPLWRKLYHKQEIMEIIESTLIKNGEICGTEILTENLLKMELGDKRNQSLNEKEQVLMVLNNALRKAREMAQCRGPLIFVKVDKAYYGISP